MQRVRLLAAALLVSAACSPAADETSGWTARAPAPDERSEIGATVLGGEVWVVGGLDGRGSALDGALVYDPRGDGWRTGPALPAALHHTAAASDGSRLWVVGGYTAADEPTAAVHVLEQGAWRPGPSLPSPRAAGALAWDGTRLVYGGGVGPDGVSGAVFALDGDRWRRIGELSVPREHLASASDGNGATWFLAGRTGGLDTNVSDVDVVRGGGVRRAGAVPTARGGVAGFHVPGLGGCVAGGEAPSHTHPEIECLTADGEGSTLEPLRAGRHGLGTVVVDGVVYALLGGDSPRLSVTDTVEALDIPVT